MNALLLSSDHNKGTGFSIFRYFTQLLSVYMVRQSEFSQLLNRICFLYKNVDALSQLLLSSNDWNAELQMKFAVFDAQPSVAANRGRKQPCLMI